MRIEAIQAMTAKIVANYHERICAIEDIMMESINTLAEARLAKEITEHELQETLAQEESLRKKDFDALLEPLFFYQRKKEKELQSVLNSFLKEQREQARQLQAVILSHMTEKVEGYEQSIQKSIEETKRHIEAIQKECHRIGVGLQYLFDRRDSLTLEELKKTLMELYRVLGLKNHINKTQTSHFDLGREVRQL